MIGILKTMLLSSVQEKDNENRFTALCTPIKVSGMHDLEIRFFHV